MRLSTVLFPVISLGLIAMLLLPGCAPAYKRGQPRSVKAGQPEKPLAPFASTYKPMAASPLLIQHATILTAAGKRLVGGSILLEAGKIVEIGQVLQVKEGVDTIDAAGKWITPGIIDVHSHIGALAAPYVKTNLDVNEMTSPVTAEVWVEHSVWPQDPQFWRALAGGVTTMLILPGSGNLIGGRGVTLKNVPARTVQAMKFPGAPHALKMACGENPKHHYGKKGRAPSTSMGNLAGYRQAWIKAQAYLRKWQKHKKELKQNKAAKPPDRDLAMETLAGVLRGEILVHNHCYRADEMALMLELAKEFGYKITAFHHAVEAYKIADLLAQADVCAAMWADWWGFKLEAYDGIRENVALVDRAGGCAIVHSDSAEMVQRLNQEAAKIMAAANRIGFSVTREKAIKWITINAAKALGIDKVTGSLEKGKMADLVIWSGDPFSVYSKAEKVFVDGALVFDRNNPKLQPRSDFELGILPPTGKRR